MKTNRVLAILLLWNAITISVSLHAQPYVDPIQVRYTYGLGNIERGMSRLSHRWVGSDLPIKLKPETYLLLSPSFEAWQPGSDGSYEAFPELQSVALPVGLILPLANSKWSVTAMAIPRWNGEKIGTAGTFQFGVVTFASCMSKPGKQFRAGVYVNNEFYGLFVMPLFGMNWRLSDKDYLFGMLPGRLTYEHQFTGYLFGGITFRAPNNSYRLNNGLFVRLNDHQLSAHLDFYIGKNICLTIEPGIGVFRKLRVGLNDRNYISEIDWNDGSFVKVNAAYRIRLEN